MEPKLKAAVTTPADASPADVAAARAAAERHGLPFVARRNRGLARLCAGEGLDAALVVGARQVALFAGGGTHPFSAGMGELRAKRRREGETATADPFLDAAALEPGDAVLDGTLGLAADALVAAEAVGEAGRVVGLEASPILAALAAEGLARLAAPAARRVEVRRADHAELLRALPAKSFDVVLFDPMFRAALRQAPGFDLVRRLADARPLSAEALAEARRVARRHVLVKDAAPGWDLTRLGLVPLPSRRGAKRYYARVPAL